jgi:hypothetical protein
MSAFSFRGVYRPGIHCIGAAIGFLSGEQVRIPMWVDYLYLGWLWRSVSAPTKFVPRYWKATRLVWLMIRYGAQGAGQASAIELRGKSVVGCSFEARAKRKGLGAKRWQMTDVGGL